MNDMKPMNINLNIFNLKSLTARQDIYITEKNILSACELLTSGFDITLH